ncbi:hypothetical protein ACYUJ6_03740 [Clostridium sp. JNZ X4-2]
MYNLKDEEHEEKSSCISPARRLFILPNYIEVSSRIFNISKEI